MHTLQNDFMKLSVDDNGALQELLNCKTGQQYAGGGMLWRLYFQREDQMDREIIATNCTPEIRFQNDKIQLVYSQVVYGVETLNIQVHVTVWLEDDEAHWTIALQNNADVILRECQFPLLHGVQLKDDQPLLWADRGGMLFPDIRSEIKNCFTHYVASDHLFLHKDVAYPGTSTTNCYLFPAQDEGLYCACYDEDFGQTLHMFRLYGEKLECGFARYPSLEKGEKCQLPEFVVSAYSGNWHVPAKKYRKWADRWFSHQTPPEWVQKMKGWQRIILKHQYGEVHYNYHELSTIDQDGSAAGINDLHLFGWWKGGMDNSNPDYQIDDALGGKDVLKQQIAKFQEKGAVILYSNGRLIDLATDYYKTTGRRISIKDKFGAEIRDAYRFRASGSYTGHFGNRTFTAACPACPEWLDKMKEVVDLAVELGCKGVFFDQLGMNEFPCFDPSHGHEVPFMHISRQKANLVKELRDYARSKDPNIGIGIECITDLSVSYCDFIHSWPGYAETTNQWEEKDEKPVLKYFIDWFRYCFPEIIMTDRDIRDDTDIERRVNHALLKGLRSDVEIYRCRKTIAETPHYSAYLKQANRLREDYAELLLQGKYIDTDNFTCDHPEVDARAFINGDQMAVVATQSHLAKASVTIDAPGYAFVKSDKLGNVECKNRDNGVALQLSKNGLAVLIFQKIDSAK